MMNQAILDFAKQFRFTPKIENGPLRKYKKFIVAGMGGSHWSVDLIKCLLPELQISIHSDYGLPKYDLTKSLIIVSSYSGDTEESISVFHEAMERKLPVVAVTVGGQLLDLAKNSKIPYVQIPNTGIQPRSAIALSFMAMLKVMKQRELARQGAGLEKIIKPAEIEAAGKRLAGLLSGHVPIIYSSQTNYVLAHNWKIKFNETGKVPAFCNVFPELNHHEMTGFDVKDASRHLSEKFHFVFLKDDDDHPQVQKRMDITAKLYRDRNLPVEILMLQGQSRVEKMFSSLVLADWTAYHTGEGYGLETEQVPMVEEFKGLIQ